MANLNNTQSNMIVTGTNLADTISNTGSNVIINALAGNDNIMNYDGSNISISGGAGSENIGIGANRNDISSGKNITVNGGADNDFITSGNDRGVLYEYTNGDGIDFINGFNSNDTLQINDSIYSTMISGDDFVVLVGAGSITLKNSANISIKIKDAFGYLSTYNTNASNILKGTDSDDAITNTSKNSTVLGYAGNDKIWNYVDNVFMHGGDDHDDIISNGDNVTINGGNGAESIESTSDSGLIFGDAGNDTLILRQGKNNTLEGGANNDLIILENSEGHNAINYRLGDGYDTVYGFTASDVLWAYDTAWISSTVGNDIVLTFLNGSVTLKDAAKIGRPRIALNITDNTTTGTIGAATEIVDANTRTRGIKITCNELANEIYGGYGNDSLYGGAGNDLIFGNAGDDLIYGETGNDTLTGDAGKDTFIYSNGDGNDIITDFENIDTLQIGSGNDTYSTLVSGNDIIINVGEGSITLRNARNNSQINIIGKLNTPGGNDSKAS